ncbi:unnamed protein product, partial [Chrysoparadoxa australica]
MVKGKSADWAEEGQDGTVDTICVCKNRRQKGVYWPARICDADEVSARLKAIPEEARAEHFKTHVLLEFLCGNGHFFTDWVLPSSIKPFQEVVIGTTSYNSRVDYQAAQNWALQLLNLMEADDDKNNEQPAAGSSQYHRYNQKAFRFFSDQLECPWVCPGCSENTTSCSCEKGFAKYLQKTLTSEENRHARMACGNSLDCVFCCPPGRLVFIAEWANQGGWPFPEGGHIKGSKLLPKQAKKTALRPSRCGTCAGCTAPDCGLCHACLDMLCFRGPGIKHQVCVKKTCERLEARVPDQDMYGSRGMEVDEGGINLSETVKGAAGAGEDEEEPQQ